MIIGISGKANAGKDTLADMIIEASCFAWRKAAFAFSVKEVASILSGIPLMNMFSRTDKGVLIPTLGISVGQLQQRIGEGLRGSVDKDVWIFALLNKIDLGRNTIITDVRYQNEAEFIAIREGLLVRVNRPDKDDGTGRDKNHSSEIDLDDWDDWGFVVNNDGSLENLHRHARKIAKSADGSISATRSYVTRSLR